MSLKKALKDFNNIFGRKDEDIGSITYNENFLQEDQNDLELFYGLIKFERLITIGGELFLNIQSFNNLDKSQIGWRLVKDKQGNIIEDNENWNKNWIVFGDRNGDAIYYNDINKSVEGSVNKQHKYLIASSLETFFQILVDCMKLEEEKYGFDTVDDEEETIPEFINDIYLIVNKYLDKKHTDDFMTFFFE